jgi:RND superfamily putative drug exporter
MLPAIARVAIAVSRRVLACVLLVIVGAAVFGVPVTGGLSNGGFRDPTSQSWHAAQLLAEKFGAGDMQLVIAVSSDDGVHSAPARAAGVGIVDELARLPYVTGLPRSPSSR